MTLRVGVLVVQNLSWDRWRSRVLEVEQLGYDGVYVWDHLVHRTQEPTDPLFDGLTLLAAAATVTSTISSVVSRGRLLDEAALAAGRDPAAIRRSVLIGSDECAELT